MSPGCCLWGCFKDRMEREGLSSPAQCRAAASDAGSTCKLIPDLFPACCSQLSGSCQTPIPGHTKHREQERCSSLPSAARAPQCPRTAAALGVPAHLDVWCFLQEPAADRHESILWPLVEPVNGCAVDHSWEPPGPHTQGGAHGGEAEHNLGQNSSA